MNDTFFSVATPPILIQIDNRLDQIDQRISQLEINLIFTQEYYTLRQYARLKRGVEMRRNKRTGQIESFESFYNTLRGDEDLQPPMRHKVGGKLVMHRSDVQKYLPLDDEAVRALNRALRMKAS